MECDMMVFTRRRNDKIHIGDDIVITIVSVKLSKVFIGVAAPLGVEVHRHEVYERIAARKKTAAKNGGRGGTTTVM